MVPKEQNHAFDAFQWDDVIGFIHGREKYRSGPDPTRSPSGCAMILAHRRIRFRLLRSPIVQAPMRPIQLPRRNALRTCRNTTTRSALSKKKPGTSNSGFRNGKNKNQTYFSFAARAIKSPMRLEKPHSLSYQLTTLTMRLPTTLVRPASMIELCGSWMMSLLTIGSSV